MCKLLEIKSLNFRFENKCILSNVSLNIGQGECIGVIGKNGAGKSTLFSCITGENKKYSGEILLDGETIKVFSSKERAKKISFIPQNFKVENNFCTVEEFVVQGRRPYSYLGFFKKEDFEIANKYIECCKLKKLKEKLLSEISGGEFQRAQIARAMTQGANILIFDETLSSCDIQVQNDFFKIIKSMLIEKNTSILLSIHDINLALKFCSRIIMLKDGNILFDDNVENVSAELLSKCFDTEVTRERNQIYKNYFYY